MKMLKFVRMAIRKVKCWSPGETILVRFLLMLLNTMTKKQVANAKVYSFDTHILLFIIEGIQERNLNRLQNRRQG